MCLRGFVEPSLCTISLVCAFWSIMSKGLLSQGAVRHGKGVHAGVFSLFHPLCLLLIPNIFLSWIRITKCLKIFNDFKVLFFIPVIGNHLNASINSALNISTGFDSELGYLCTARIPLGIEPGPLDPKARMLPLCQVCRHV